MKLYKKWDGKNEEGCKKLVGMNKSENKDIKVRGKERSRVISWGEKSRKVCGKKKQKLNWKKGKEE